MNLSHKSVQIFLGKLLNNPIDSGTEIFLSSAQRARLYDWLKEAKIPFDEAALTTSFNINQLLGFVQTSQNAIKASENPSVNMADLGKHGAIYGVGIDIQSIPELFPATLALDLKADQMLRTIFTLSEISYCQTKKTPEESLTGIFAAKEAIAKAGCENPGSIEIHFNSFGRPCFQGYILSISHSGEYAVAVAFKEGLEALSANNFNLGGELEGGDVKNILAPEGGNDLNPPLNRVDLKEYKNYIFFVAFNIILALTIQIIIKYLF